MTSKAKRGTDPGQPLTKLRSDRLLHSSREERIRCRAYEIYLERGAEPGHELEDWLQAERELTAIPSNSQSA
jgi:hypothetical protein